MFADQSEESANCTQNECKLGESREIFSNNKYFKSFLSKRIEFFLNLKLRTLDEDLNNSTGSSNHNQPKTITTYKSMFELNYPGSN